MIDILEYAAVRDDRRPRSSVSHCTMPTAVCTSSQIRPPILRCKLVARDALLARLQHAQSRAKLVLLCAPAGYGKTTLLVQLMARLPAESAMAWVNVHEDDDLQRLVACLLAA